MRAHSVTAAVIIIASSAAAVVANSAWYHMPWLRKPIAVKEPAAPQVKPGFILIDEVLEGLVSGTAHFIDAREANDFEDGHIRGAVHLPSSAIFKNIDHVYEMGVDPTGKVIVYCGGGNCEASHNVADALRRDFAFDNVLIYENGWEEVEVSGRFEEFIEIGGES